MSSSITLILKIESNTDLELTDLASLAGQTDSGIVLSLPPHGWDYRHESPSLAFTWMLGI